MNDVGKAEMLAAARKKLKDYEARHKVEGRSSPASSIISSEPGNGAALNGRSSVISEDSAAMPPILPQSSSSQSLMAQRNGTTASPFPMAGNEWYQAYTQLKTQHDELCQHYSQLHSAYSQVNANGIHVDAENQIVQLQAALSTMVEEKLTCQSDLRQANENIEKLRQKLEILENQKPPTSSSSFHQNSEEIRKLTDSIAQKDSLLTARHLELENSRREMSTIQANLLNVQHERSEAHARVKSLVRETANQESKIAELKKDIEMKDLYLKQLGAKGPEMQKNDSEDLKIELENLKIEKSRFLADISNLKSHYSEREQSLQEKQREMAVEMEKLNFDFHLEKNQLEQTRNDLEIAKSELERFRNSKFSRNQNSEQVENSESNISEEEVLRRIREACHAERHKWERKLEEIQKSREEEVLEKDRQIFEREQNLAEIEMKYRILEERTMESTANGADLLSLSEQLQNEKATVSRAVAQNKELKERLLETEDRFVSLTEEKANVELARQSAEHQVRELTKQLNLEAAGLVGNLSEVIASQPHLNEEKETSEEAKNDPALEDALDSLQRENSEIRAELHQATNELQQVRAELRRSNNHNEQMDQIMRQNAEDENQNSIHVELTQAVGRVQELATENEHLREALGEIREQLEQERVERRMEMEKMNVNELELKEVKGSEEAEEVKEPEIPTREDLWARKELEKRFAKAMLQNADLVEQIDRLEHINQQLELENDTIADHVVLYQHQRKLVRERLRVKDEQLKSMEDERQKTVERCQELQNVLMTVLKKGGVLKEYETNSLSRKAARRVSRSYSHSTVDEMSGDEDIVVDAKLEEVPERERIHGFENSEKTIQKPPTTPTIFEEKERKTPESMMSEEKWKTSEDSDASVRRIMEIISDISKPRPLPSGQLHCTQCIGDLQEL